MATPWPFRVQGQTEPGRPQQQQAPHAGYPPPRGDVYTAYGGPNAPAAPQPPPGYPGAAQSGAQARPPPMMPMHMPPPADLEAGPKPDDPQQQHHAHVNAGGKWEQEVRRGFVQKVLFIVAIQLLVTTGICLVFFFVDPVNEYVTQNQWVFFASWVLALALLITMSCSTRVRRKYPLNYCFLVVFTLVFGTMAATITARYNVETVGIALAVTAATVCGAFFVAKFTKLDLTGAGGFLTAILFGVIVMSVIAIFWRNKWFYFLIAVVAAILFTAYLIYDLQLLMGGRKYQISPDEYIFAAVSIYLDIVQIFLNLLQIVGFLSE